MRGTRLAGVSILALAATVSGVALASIGGHVASSRADTCDPSICGSTGGGGGGGGGGGTSTSTPPPTSHKHVNLPPGPVTDLHGVVNHHAGQITFAWTNPGAKDLNQIVVRRGPARDCPKTTAEGLGIGGTAIRTSQTDAHAGRPSGYCYSVFAVDRQGNVSPPAARSLTPPDLTPPSTPTGVTASGTPGHVVVTWSASTGHPQDYIVRRSSSGGCPPGPTRAALVKVVGADTTTVNDTTALAGVHYCYAVFAVDKAGNVSHPGDSQPFTVIAPTPTPTSTPTPPTSTPPVAHSEQTSSSLVPAEAARLVAAIAVAVIVFGGIVLGGIRLLQNPRRRDDWAYGRAAGAPRIITIDRYDTRALVIPAVIVVVGLLLMVALAGVVL
jgi:hypothetical protein